MNACLMCCWRTTTTIPSPKGGKSPRQISLAADRCVSPGPIPIPQTTGLPSRLCKYCKYTCLQWKAISTYLVQPSSPRNLCVALGPTEQSQACEGASAAVPLSAGLEPCAAQSSGKWSSSIENFLILLFIGIYTLVRVAGYRSFHNQPPTLGLDTRLMGWGKELTGEERKHREVRKKEHSARSFFVPGN